MNTVNGRMSGMFQMRGHRFISRQHEFFDNAVGDIAGTPRDPGHLALRIEFDQRLRQIKIN